MKIWITILTLLLATNSLLAQEDNWQLTLANGNTISNISIQNIDGDSLAISQSGQTSWINVDSITEIRKIVESKFWTGAGIGALAGAGLGAIIASSSYEDKHSFFTLPRGVQIGFGAISGSVAGFLIGGTVGGLASKDEVYDLSGMTLKEKLGIIRLRVVSKEQAE